MRLNGKSLKMKKLWKDHWPWWSYFIVVIVFLTLIPIISFLYEFKLALLTDIFNILSFLIIFLVFLFMLITILSHRLSSMTTEGIYMGTVSRDDHIENPKLYLRTFLSWKEIKKIKIIKKKTKRSYGIMDFVSTLKITSKNGKIYQCYINDMPGFYKNINFVSKHSLLDSGSYTGSPTTDIPLKQQLFNVKSKYFKILIKILIGSLIVVGIYIILRLIFGI